MKTIKVSDECHQRLTALAEKVPVVTTSVPHLVELLSLANEGNVVDIIQGAVKYPKQHGLDVPEA